MKLDYPLGLYKCFLLSILLAIQNGIWTGPILPQSNQNLMTVLRQNFSKCEESDSNLIFNIAITSIKCLPDDLNNCAIYIIYTSTVWKSKRLPTEHLYQVLTVVPTVSISRKIRQQVSYTANFSPTTLKIWSSENVNSPTVCTRSQSIMEGMSIWSRSNCRHVRTVQICQQASTSIVYVHLRIMIIQFGSTNPTTNPTKKIWRACTKFLEATNLEPYLHRLSFVFIGDWFIRNWNSLWPQVPQKELNL